MAKYYRPLEDILDEVVAQIPSEIQVSSFVDNTNLTYTIGCCDVLYAQRGFNVTIDDKSYEIIGVDHAAETLTLSPNFGTDPTIAVGTIFDLYSVKFFHGTPVTTQTELNAILKAENKTPMIWLWSNYKEQIFRDMMVERKIPVELFALTQSYKKLKQLNNEDIYRECVEAMRRLWYLFTERMEYRTDLFYTDDLQYRVEDFPHFGILARNKGSEASLFFDQLAGCGSAIDLELMFKDDSCPCPPIIHPLLGIGAAPIAASPIA